MRLNEIGPVFWKEIRDLARDRKTIIATVLLPLFSLPLLGILAVALAAEQKPVVAIVSEDNGRQALNVTSRILKLSRSIASYNKVNMDIVVCNSLNKALGNSSIDLILYLPRGFVENLTKIDRIAYYRFIERIGSATTQMAENIIRASLNVLSREVAEKRVALLSRKAGVSISPDVILEPLKELAPPQPVGPKGEKVSQAAMLRAEFARFLMFALFFVVTPATVFISDSIIGERERRTLEMTLSSPIDPRSVLLGKLFASTILGFLASLADIAGVVIYLGILSGTGYAAIDKGLILVHSLDVALTVFMTTLILIPVITRAESIRSAQTTSSLITMIALAVYFSVLFVDIARLPNTIRYLLYIIPYTHSVLAIYNYVILQPLRTALHLLVIAMVSFILIFVSLRFFDVEKTIMHKEQTIKT